MSETNYAELINADNVRRTIRRTFENKASEILAELFQNSQRAMAKNVRITTGDGYFSYEDDGCGLKPGLDGIHQLLKIAESGFEENPTIQAQDPMGVGVHALLAHDMVGCVTFASGDLSLTLDTKRWWGDKAYYTTWADRVETLDVPVDGLRVTVQADEFFIQDILHMLNASASASDYVNGKFYSSQRPARGYEGWLSITANGKPVDTSLRESALVERPFLDLTYQGCRVIVGRKSDKKNSRSGAYSSVNWYGQQVALPDLAKIGGGMSLGFHVHVWVKDGRPFNPKAPTRSGIIEDAAWAEFAEWLKDRIFAFTFDEANRSRVSADWVLDCFHWDKERATKESPYFVAKAYRDPHEEGRSNLGCSSRTPDELEESRIFLYGEQPNLVRCRVVLLEDGAEDGEGCEMEHGVSSFFSADAPAYKAVAGDRTRLKIATVKWRPGAEHANAPGAFHERGEWCLSREGQEDAWKAVEQDVMAFDATCSYDIRDCENVTVGCEDIVDFCEGDLPWIAFDYADGSEDSWEEQENAYSEALDDIVRGRYGDAIKPDFTLSDLANKLKTSFYSIEKLEFGEDDEKRRTVTATLAGGAVKTLRMV